MAHPTGSHMLRSEAGGPSLDNWATAASGRIRRIAGFDQKLDAPRNQSFGFRIGIALTIADPRNGFIKRSLGPERLQHTPQESIIKNGS